MAAILLGNGFSIAYNPAMFAYDALVQGAEFPGRLLHIFDTFGTSDFEHVMRRLNQAHDLLVHYDGTERARQALQGDINLVRTSLIHALAQYHPHSADIVPADEKERCAQFLSQYDRIFTTNYDLLLYWVQMAHLVNDYFDGFGGGNPLSWQRGDTPQNIYYLHGGLHLYKEGRATHKRRSVAGVPILGQLTEAMEKGDVPLFVSEGEWAQKLAAIEDSAYLRYCYDALVENRQALTLYGFGFNQNDRHISNAIARSNTRRLEVVLHSQAPRAQRRRIRERARNLHERMEGRQDRDVRLDFIESDTIQVWR